MHADLTGFEQGGEDPDPAGVAHQPEHSGDPFDILHRGQRPWRMSTRARSPPLSRDPEGPSGSGMD
ncbi:hypothetical protein NHF46_00405 [Arthrobacter alpinus]|nr:hypothetical protein [Arthrobacter alpinus]